MKNNIELLKVSIWEHPVTKLIEHIQSTRVFIEIHSINAEILVQSLHTNELRNIIKNNCCNIIDGFWVKKFLNLKYSKAFPKISGSDLTYDLCKLTHINKWKIFFLGSTENILNLSEHNIKKLYPGIRISKYSPPFTQGTSFSKEQKKLIHDILLKEKPKIILVCFGAPKQELWISDNHSFLNSIGVKAALSAGGSLDFVAGVSQRAPVWIQLYGLEWIHRLLLEPRRFKRQIIRLPIFFILSLHDTLKYKIKLYLS